MGGCAQVELRQQPAQHGRIGDLARSSPTRRGDSRGECFVRRCELNERSVGAGIGGRCPQAGQVLVIDEMGVHERRDDVEASTTRRLQQDDPNSLDEIGELGSAEVEQAQGGVNRKMVVEHSHPVAVGQRACDGQFSCAGRAVDDDVLAPSSEVDHLRSLAGWTRPCGRLHFAIEPAIEGSGVARRPACRRRAGCAADPAGWRPLRPRLRAQMQAARRWVGSQRVSVTWFKSSSNGLTPARGENRRGAHNAQGAGDGSVRRTSTATVRCCLADGPMRMPRDGATSP